MEFNGSNDSNNSTTQECPYDYCVEDTTYRKVVGTLIFLVVWPFIVQDIKYFPIGRPAAALLGATLMVVFTIVPQGQVFHILGDRGNIQTICLLVGMMALSYYYDREGLLRVLTLWIFGKGRPFRQVLWKVCILTAVLSALITNDATCVVITPLLLTEHKKQKRNENEIIPLVLSIATSANIGSASTFFGNPQNAYIASTANLSLLIFFITSLPAAILGLAINILLLYIIYFRIIFNFSSQNSSNLREVSEVVNPSSGTIVQERLEQSIQLDNSTDPFSSSDIAAQRNQLSHNDDDPESKFTPNSIYGAANLSASLPILFSHSEQLKRDLVFKQSNKSIGEKQENEKRRWTQKIFSGWLVIMTLVLIGLLATPPQKYVKFNLGLVPVGVAVFIMLADTILNFKHARNVMVEIDWPVILMFFGLFVWLAGFANTGLPNLVFDKIHKHMDLSTIKGVLLFTVFVTVGSNILSNVPLVILLIDRIDDFQCGLDDCSQLVGVLLAWISTIAGNFTLIGSIANLIVAEKTKSCTGYNLTFFAYLKFGFVSTLIVLFSGLPIVYFTGKMVKLSF